MPRTIMRSFRVRAVSAAAVAACATASAGCSDALLRETVLANTETLIGVAVAQDPKTSMYQGRIGYARHELFLVPTGKRVVKEGESGESSSDAASTPEVLGEIMADGEIPSADGVSAPGRVGVYQRLAVGRTAVQSGAAVALLARDATTARAMATGGAQAERDLDVLAARSAGVTIPVGSQRLAWPEAADAWSRARGFDGYDDLCARGTLEDRRALARRWQGALDEAAAQQAAEARKAEAQRDAARALEAKEKAKPKDSGVGPAAMPAPAKGGAQ